MTDKSIKFSEIPQFTRAANYSVDVSWSYLEKWYQSSLEEEHLDVDPDFQRGYVWTERQKTRYVEFILRGGQTGRNIYTNNPNWHLVGKPKPKSYNDYVLVDGKQRLSAVLDFLQNQISVFDGYRYCDFADKLRLVGPSFKWHVNDLETRAEVLQWYIDLNSGGTVHTDEEMDRVKALLKAESKKTRK